MKKLNLKTLSLALLCFVSVQSVWANDVTVSTAQELTDALAAASKTSSNPTVITLGADFSGTSTTFLTPDFTIASDTYVTLNLNGHTLTGGGYGSVFNNLGTLVIEDSTATGDPAKGIYSSSNTGGYQSGKITGGYAKRYETDKTMSDTYGGAVWNLGSLTIASGTFTGNYGRNGGAFGNYEETGVSYTITGGLICNNTSCNQGGAIATWTTNSEITVSNAAFISNTCAKNGGAIYNCYGSITVNSGTFTSNSAKISGGAVLTYTKSITITGGTFTSNSANYGGAVSGSLSSTATVTITGGTFTNNTATTYGGAVYSGCKTTIEAGTFTSNSAQYCGAVYGDNSYTTTITGGTFTGNYTSESGYGAIQNRDKGKINISGNPIIKDNKVSSTDNTARDIVQTVTLTGDITSGADIRFTMSGEVAYNTNNYKINSGIAHSTDASYLVKTVAGDGAYLIKNDAISENDNIDLPHATAYTLASESPTVASVSYTRNVKNSFGTIVLPFVPETDSNIKYFMVDDGAPSEQTIKLTSVDTPVANTPYIFKYYGDIDKTNGTDVTFSAANTTLKAAKEGTNTSGYWTLTGTYSDVTKNGSSENFYYVASKNGTFYRAEGNTHFAPYRSWATYSGSGNAKSFTIMLDDETTGIATIENGEMQLNMGTIYDLQGRKVNTPQRGNIYIINGKKISY